MTASRTLNDKQATKNTTAARWARQVCTSCKLGKKKCNKAMPTCSQCAKRDLRCEYREPEPARRVHTSLTYEPSLSVSRTDPKTINYSSVLFLDPSILTYGQIEFPDTAFTIPAHILQMLGDQDELQRTTAKYFDHIHKWMPFISKKRFYDMHLRSCYLTQPNVTILLLCMKLSVTIPPSDPRAPQTPLYRAAKHFLLELESSSGLSLLILQSMVLLALYEIGHAIYPVAFLTIGTCARYANALGIGAQIPIQIKRVLTLVEIEERRRVWWAIVILDRFINIGCPGRPLATTNPQSSDLLPLDDTAWDEGVVEMGEAFTLASPLASHMSKFALLCQGARLLGQVLDYVSNPRMIDDETWIQLDRTLHAMITASLEVDQPDSDQIAFLYSSLVALFAPWLGRDSTVSSNACRQQQRAIEVMEEIGFRMQSNVVGQQCFACRNMDDLPPWGLFFAYHICLASQISEKITLPSEVVRSLKATLVQIDARWNLAGTYLQLLEAHTAINKFA